MPPAALRETVAALEGRIPTAATLHEAAFEEIQSVGSSFGGASLDVDEFSSIARFPKHVGTA